MDFHAGSRECVIWCSKMTVEIHLGPRYIEYIYSQIVESIYQWVYVSLL